MMVKQSELTSRRDPLPATADVVVVGAGSFGCSAAYQLAAAGLVTVLVDRFDLASQTSPRAAGNTKQIRPQDVLTRLAIDSVTRIVGFAEETGVPLDFHQTGSLQMAAGAGGVSQRQTELATADRHRIEATTVAPDDLADLAPFVDVDDSMMLWFSPGDLYLHPPDLLAAYLEAAARAGAVLVGSCPVTGLLTEGDRVVGVRTPQGDVSTPMVIDSAGAWSGLVSERAGITIPMVPMRHQIMVSQPTDAIANHHPICRALDTSFYLRPCEDGVLLGGFEANPQVHEMKWKPEGFQISDLTSDQDVLDRLAAEVDHLFPFLRRLEVKERRAGLPTLTPDNLPIVGPVDGLEGFLVASGCCVGGLSISPSVGVVLTDMVLGRPTSIPVAELKLARFTGTTWSQEELLEACKSTYSSFYVKTDKPPVH